MRDAAKKKPNFSGARSSNAGDDFHVWWTLRHALTLLDSTSLLNLVTVEGLTYQDETNSSQETWGVVDCALYFGGSSIESAEKIIIEQVKYSTTNSAKPWTVANLKYSARGKRKKSIIAKFSSVFSEIKKMNSNLIASNNLTIRLVSNRPIHSTVQHALESENSSDYCVLKEASELSDEDFKLFIRALNFDLCGGDSRFNLEEQITISIADLTESDAHDTVNNLKDKVSRLMLPDSESKSDITCATVLSWMGVSDHAALFPCPAEVKHPHYTVPRENTHSIIKELQSGTQYICLNGEGGCGKTTILQEIVKNLSTDSIMIVFDCYGGGSYLNSSAYRHRPNAVYLQLINELASRLNAPLLIGNNSTYDYPRIFRKRLEIFANLVTKRNENALLVIAIDAADNSIIAANQCTPPEVSFINEFAKINELPKNVRFIITSRSSRISELNLNSYYKYITISNFSFNETNNYVYSVWTEASQQWVEEFHALSNQNVRVQNYAFQYAKDDPERALEYLRPKGKILKQIFYDQFQELLYKDGEEQKIKLVCAGLTVMPRPIPIKDFAAIIKLTNARIYDICNYLPGVKIESDLISFSDEEFEEFARDEGSQQLTRVESDLADYLVKEHYSNSYAAKHVAGVLFKCGRKKQIIELIEKCSSLEAIPDLILRGEIQRQRLRIAMRICLASENIPDAITILLIGAEALKTDIAFKKMLIDNPDLAVHFAYDTVSRTVLYDSDEYEHHGRILFHLINLLTLNKTSAANRILVTEKKEMLEAWLVRRKEDFLEQNRSSSYGKPWLITVNDIVAQIEAVLRQDGCEKAVDTLLSWKPKTSAFFIALTLVKKLIVLGEIELVKACLNNGSIDEPWRSLLSVPLAIVGEEIDIFLLSLALVHPLCCKFIDVKNYFYQTGDAAECTRHYLDVILTGCEFVISQDENAINLKPVLELFIKDELRRGDNLHHFDLQKLDVSLRAFALLKRLEGKEPDLKSFWISYADPTKNFTEKELKEFGRKNQEDKSELKDFLDLLLKFFDLRSQVLLKNVSLQNIEGRFNEVLKQFSNQNYRIQYRYHYLLPKIYKQIACSLVSLNMLPSINPSILWQLATLTFETWPEPFSEEQCEVLRNLSLLRPLHGNIRRDIKQRTDLIRVDKIASSQKLENLLKLARLLLPINKNEAYLLFQSANHAANEVDVETQFELKLIAPLVEKSISAFNGQDIKRQIAHQIATIVMDVSVRLQIYDNFPWKAIIGALATLDMPQTLAYIGMWEDSNVVGRQYLLPRVIDIGLENDQLSPAQAVALLKLLDKVDVDLLKKIVAKVDNLSKKKLAEEIAFDELKRFSHLGHCEINEIVQSLLQNGSPSYWPCKLEEFTNFLSKNSLPMEYDYNNFYDSAKEKIKADNFLSAIDFYNYDFSSADGIKNCIKKISAEAKNQEIFLDDLELLLKISDYIDFENYSLFLNLICFDDLNISPYCDVGSILVECLKEWSGKSFIIEDWPNEKLPLFIKTHFLNLGRHLSFGYASLPELLGFLTIPKQEIAKLLINRIEEHIDGLEVSVFYSLVELIISYIKPQEAQNIIERHIDRLIKRIPEKDYSDFLCLSICPNKTTSSLAKLLYAFLGDVDVRIRWRAAHTIRALAKLNDFSVIDELIQLYNQEKLANYRLADSPFYWMASRLWLLIALDRVAGEMPLAIIKHADTILDFARDESFPHVVVRHFAKSILKKLSATGELKWDIEKKMLLESINASPLPSKIITGYRGYTSFYGESHSGRFQFDSMDTLPYWYSKAINIFHDVDSKKFLDTAESWIIEKWKVDLNATSWGSDKRRARFPSHEYNLWTHRHGYSPTLENYKTYLEWHAMCCSIGELMQNHALASPQDDFGGVTLQNWIEENALTVPPIWLSDLRSTKPLKREFWTAPEISIKEWIKNISSEDFLREMGLDEQNGQIIVGSYYRACVKGYETLVRVSTALDGVTFLL